ncbi:MULTISPECIES: gamma-glutamyl-gamma-aminobutyrate hydrolase family protein [unclassified Clostridium]|uniref:gamma-glutamyl-gamma-aminobutyrate hydrolase family protein n=1 Tax=unclassified Clostridium TaxID=2614128 RepID=UPI000298289C|nr:MULTISPECIES: gamma-glutamyl-gamma-aminobutyrate hydrolase family protein [unclassified Clostridium]EKQ50193.1 MAG: putative glutamine amidotransferase [Clostridium sp. Maddingley MBC34-26]
MKTIIGITSSIKKETFRIFSNVGYEYADKIHMAGGIPLEIPVLINVSIETLNRLVDYLDGIIFTGGDNIDPLWYGEQPLFEQCIETKLRNKFERALFFAAKNKRLPILGICRGSQLINVLQGGSLFQDIKTQVNTKIDHSGAGLKLEEKQHFVYLEKNSLLTKIYNKEKISVNSFHIQCIKELGEDLKIAAKSEDGITEAVECKGDFFMQGVQWHPEGLEDQMPLFKEFVRVCSCKKNDSF